LLENPKTPLQIENDFEVKNSLLNNTKKYKHKENDFSIRRTHSSLIQAIRHTASFGKARYQYTS
jgi:predicted DNA binding CopG/RHH family protein